MKKIIGLCLLLCCLAFTAFAKDKTDKDVKEDCKPIATMTVEEMEQQWLQEDTAKDLLYVKLKDDRVEAYEGLAASRSLRKQLIQQLPNTEMLRLYTTNKAAYEQMARMLSDYEEDNYNFNGYKVITDTDNPKKLENGNQVYRFWFMKIKKEKTGRRGVNFPIGIGIGIGGGHHHGPWIGVGL